MVKYLPIIVVCLFFQIEASQEPSQSSGLKTRKLSLGLQGLVNTYSLPTTPRNKEEEQEQEGEVVTGEATQERRTLSRGVSSIMKKLLVFQMRQHFYSNMSADEIREERERFINLSTEIQGFQQTNQRDLDKNCLHVDHGYEGNPWTEVLRVQEEIDSLLKPLALDVQKSGNQ